MFIQRTIRPWLLASAVVVLVSGASGAEKAPEATPEAAIAKALAAKSPVHFKGMPLQDMADFLGGRHGINIVLDRRALDEVGLVAETTVTCKLEQASLRTVLRLVLRERDLTYVVRHEVLLITASEAAESGLPVDVYDVRDLVDLGEDRPAYASRHDYDTLTELIKSAIGPDTWDDVGGPGAVEGAFGTLVVAQTDDVREEISLLLDVLREGRKSKPGDVFRLVPPSVALDQRALDRATAFDFEEVPLADVLDFVGNTAKVDVHLDVRALDEAGIASDTPVTLRVKEAPLKAALRQMLRPLGLGYYWEENVLVITTAEEAENWPEVRVYNVADLLVPPGADPDDEAAYDYDTLVVLLWDLVAPDTWDMVGGYGAATFFEDLLVVAQAPNVHEQIDALFRQLRAPVAGQRSDSDATRLRQALAKRTTADFVETPLADVLRFLSEEHSLDVEVDHRALEDVGIDPADARVTLRVSSISLRSALTLILGGHYLTWIPLGENAILITTCEEAESHWTCRSYDVSELLDREQPDVQEFNRLIGSTIAPESWNDVGGPGTMAIIGSRLFVRQTESVHEQIGELLDRLRSMKEKHVEQSRRQ